MKSFKALSNKLFGRSVLVDHSTDVPYMIRYKMGPIRFHKMVRGDNAREMHDHPWWFITFPLRSYVEEVLKFDGIQWVSELNVVKAYRFHFRSARYAHRILGPKFKGYAVEDIYQKESNRHYQRMDELEIPQNKRHIRTIVINGFVRQMWGFYCVAINTDKGSWVSSKDYFDHCGLEYKQGKTSGKPGTRKRKPA